MNDFIVITLKKYIIIERMMTTIEVRLPLKTIPKEAILHPNNAVFFEHCLFTYKKNKSKNK